MMRDRHKISNVKAEKNATVELNQELEDACEELYLSAIGFFNLKRSFESVTDFLAYCKTAETLSKDEEQVYLHLKNRLE